MPDWNVDISQVAATIISIVAVIEIIRRIIFWKKPCVLSISQTLRFNGEPDSISVQITNRSSSAIYVKSCEVRSTQSILNLLICHLKNPLLNPRFYQNLWYAGVVYQFIKGVPVKIEPGELIEQTIEIYENPMNAICGPMLIARAVTTTGKVVRSPRVVSPPIWRLIGSRGR